MSNCVMFSGGGTAGHVNPALAIAKTLRSLRPDIRIIFTGTEKGLEAVLVPRAGFEFFPIEAIPFHKNPIELLKAVRALRRGEKACLKLMERFEPLAVVGTGGYVCGPLLSAAKARHIPRIIHEQNALPGHSNTMLSRGSDVVCISFPDTEKYFPHAKKVLLTGNPADPCYFETKGTEARKKLGMPSDRRFVLATGGSLGSRAINRAVLAYAAAQMAAGPEVIAAMPYILLGAGSRLEEETLDEAKRLNLAACEKLTIAGYLYDMVDYMAAADVVISRAGAGACAELAALGKASILIPYPYAAGDHQTYNAMAFVRAGAAICLKDDELTALSLKNSLDAICGDACRQAGMEQAARALARPSAAIAVAEAIIDLLPKSAADG